MELVEIRARISERDYKLLKKLASHYDCSMSNFVRIAITNYMSKRGMYHNGN